jgi:transcriptional regulator with XRE-family HTH domain
MLRLFGDKLRYLRHQHTISQADLGRRLGTKRAHINNIEAGRRAPSLDLVLKATDVFGVTTDYLLRDTIPVELVTASGDASFPTQQSPPQLFGSKLRYLRMRHTITQEELARQLALASHSHISFLETGHKAPSLDLVVQIADFFGMTTDYLLLVNIPVELPS